MAFQFVLLALEFRDSFLQSLYFPVCFFPIFHGAVASPLECFGQRSENHLRVRTTIKNDGNY